ncbi:MAG: DEAD/DEAH box helicase, partial [Candidatus Nomurabacteria bacterium]|nr:DEAD/DEAH box helicase [Candidatus Nomurabacteria bacterium]
ADVARQRLAFEELFGLLLASRLNKKENSKLRGYKIKFNQPQIKDFVAKLPFKLTNAQRRAIWDILCDFEKPHPMNRMLQGDVGSGKTVVAGAAAYQASLAGYQTAIMAPTEILASQHAATLDKLLSPFGVRVALLTSSVKGKARQKLYKVLASGEIDVVVGTHALIQPTVKFHKLGFTVIDEQHRFGVKQRQELSAKSENILQHKNSYKQDSLVCNLQGQTLNSLSSDAQKLLKTYPKFADGRIDYTNQKICYVTNCTVICGDEILLTERGADVIAYPNSLNGVSGFIDDLSLTLDAAVRQELSEELSAPSDFQLRIGAESVQLDEELGREWRVFPALAIFDKKFKPKTNWENKTAKWVKLSDVGKLKLMQHYAEVLKLALALQGPSLTKNILQHKNSYKQDSLVCERMPHLLSMTATPIPRSLQLTVFGDLDISVLNEQPAGRQPITTRIYQPTRRAELYKLIREQLDQGRQAYVVTPLIEQAEQADTSTTSTSRCKDRPCNKPSAARTVLVTNSSVVEKAAAEAEYKKIVKVYKDFRVGLLHGRLKPDEKDRVMRDFADHKLDILVATTVIEVGVDVPNASVMLIENADQFGLSQLHQLRGRVGRGEHQSFCYLMVSDNRPPTRRLREIEKSTDGFYLSEIDLQLRGPGEIYGTAQHGDLNLQVANLADTKLIARAAKAAENFINSGANLAKYPELRHNVSKYQRLTTLN